MTKPPTRDPWLPFRRPRPEARLRLFCLPHAGGGASIYNPWHQGLPTAIEVCAVQLPGRENRLRERPLDRLEPLVSALAGALEPYLDLPFALYGHSMGALVAWSLADALRRRGAPAPLHLFASGRRAPQHPDEPLRHDLPEEQFVAEIGGLNGTPPEVWQHAELRQLVLPLLRADFAVCETYVHRPTPPLDCPITIFGGDDDVEAPPALLEGWREHTRSRFRLRMLPGDHFFLHAARPTILAEIERELLGGWGPGG